MNWEAMGSIAELLGALGVIVSLVYLATQVRSNTAAIRAGTSQDVTNRASEISQSISLDPSATEIIYVGLRDPDALSAEQRRQFGGILLAIFRAYENVEYQFRGGFLDQGEWSGLSSNLRSTATQPGFVTWWTRHGRHGFNPEFQSFIDEVIAEHEQSA